jgi:isopenicillin-N epimerase
MTTNPLRHHWLLDPKVSYLNHGAFGATPSRVMEGRFSWLEEIEREPVQFYDHVLGPQLEEARKALGAFVGAPSDRLVFASNATTGINTALAAQSLSDNDEILLTDHEYGATRNATRHYAQQSGAALRTVNIPFPISGAAAATEAILAAVSSRTRLLVIDHVTSVTGLVLPIAEIVSEMNTRGIDTLVDGAHAPGMVPLDVEKLGATYYVGNCHKWVCSPKGAAFLAVREDRMNTLRPLVISHGAAVAVRNPAERLAVEFGWMGTSDPTPLLCVPLALRTMENLVDGGWPAVMARNRSLALKGRRTISELLEIDLPCPDDMIGSLATLPMGAGDGIVRTPFETDPLQRNLWENHRIEVPVKPWPNAGHRVLRISAQLYNVHAEYVRLGETLRGLKTL